VRVLDMTSGGVAVDVISCTRTSDTEGDLGGDRATKYSAGICRQRRSGERRFAGVG
jgi:hypothetical protein